MTLDPVSPPTSSMRPDDMPTQDIPVQNDVASNEVEELADFLRLIDGLPTEHRPDMYRALNRLVDGFERRQRILGYIQDSLCQMNLDLKYLIFDLEATRRERDDYKKRLEFYQQD